MRGTVSPISTLFFKFSFSCTNTMNQNISSKGRGEYVSLIGVYWFNGNKPQTQTSKKMCSFKRFKTMHIKKMILVILKFSRLFLCFQIFQGYFGHLEVWGYFGHFEGFSVFFILLEVSRYFLLFQRFQGILVVLEVLRVFW